MTKERLPKESTTVIFRGEWPGELRWVLEGEEPTKKEIAKIVSVGVEAVRQAGSAVSSVELIYKGGKRLDEEGLRRVVRY